MADIMLNIAEMMEEISKPEKDGRIAFTPSEMLKNQFGVPLPHYAQQYLFGATGLRIKVFHSIAGVPQSCKSPLLFDLMGHVCASKDLGGCGGAGVLYELEDKFSPVLCSSILGSFKDPNMDKRLRIMTNLTIEGAFKNLCTRAIPVYRKYMSSCTVPFIVGIDSIGGAAANDVVKKLETEGVAGKGYWEKSHYMKYFCENASQIIGRIPFVFVCINQEKEQASSTGYGPPQKKITGGVSQVFKDGHMISATYKTLASGDGKIITLRTTKTSFCDPRKIEVAFRWNRYGKLEEGNQDDYYQHRFEWAMATAKCIADPDKGVGEIRDICDVKVSEGGLVTCPTFGLKSVPPEVFEEALFDPGNSRVLNDLYIYQKIDKINDMEAYAKYLKTLKEDPVKEEKATAKVAAGLKKPAKAQKPKKESVKMPMPFDVPPEDVQIPEAEETDGEPDGQ